MINRIVVLVIDGLGAGALPDAAEYGDAGADTLVHVAEAVGGLTLPTFETLGLGHVASISGVRAMTQPIGCFGRLAFSSAGKDSVAGLREMPECLCGETGNSMRPVCRPTSSRNWSRRWARRSSGDW